MRFALFALLTVVPLEGCASNARVTSGPAPVAGGSSPIAVTNDAGSGDAGDSTLGAELAPLEALSARGSSLAAGMREVARGELVVDAGSGTRDLAPAADRDQCVRVAVAAQPAVHAWLTDVRGDVLADATGMSDGTLATRGPVCVRKGDAVTLHVEAAGGFTARFVAWASP